MSVKLTVQQLMDATIIITNIIREDRRLPQKGKYRLARMHPVLDKEFAVINANRDKMIEEYNHHEMVPNPAYKAEMEAIGDSNVTPLVPRMVPSPQFSVPEDKLQDFFAKWAEIAKEEIEVNVQPIPLEQLCLPGEPGCITGHEFIVLGGLVTE